MLLTSLPKETLSFFDALKGSSEFNHVLSALKEGKYQIIYHYEEGKGELIYEAFALEGGNPLYLAFAISEERKITGYPDPFPQKSSYALAYYLYQRESQLALANPSALKEIYRPYLSQLEPLLRLTPYEIEKRQKIRDSFLQSVAFIEQESVARSNSEAILESEKLSLEVAFQSLRSYSGEEGYQEIHLKLHLLTGKGERYPLTDLAAFISAYKGEGTILIKKPRNTLSLKLTSALFQEKDVNLLAYLVSIHADDRTLYWLKKDTLALSPAQANDVFHLFADSSISFNDATYQVYAYQKQAGLFLSPDGSITFFPALPRLDNAIISRRSISLLDPFHKSLALYVFPNEQIGELYSFFCHHGEEAYPLVKDIIEKRVVPHLGSNLAVSALSPKEGKEDASKLLSIQYYIDLDEKDHLLFHSVYQVGGKEVERNALDGNLYYTSLLFGFDNVLEEMHLQSEGSIEDEEAILAFLKEDLSKLKKVATLYLSDRLKNISLRNMSPISLSLHSDIDMLSLSASCPDYSEEQLADILSHYRKKHRFYRLGETIISLDDPSLASLDALAKEMALDPKSLKREQLPFYEALKLAAKQDKTLPIQVDEYLKKAMSDIKAFKSAPLSLDPSLALAMRPYQKDATRWMSLLREYHLSGILADDMGMGKTLESIAFLSTVSEEAPILIVAPKSVLFNWQSEFQKWLPSLRVVVLSGSKNEREAAIRSIAPEKVAYVTSYDSLRNDLSFYEGKHFSVALLDEGQYIKNAYAEKSKAVKEIDASSRFALTGTPIENNLNDLWSIFDFLMPGYLGSYEEFQSRYVKKEANAALRSLITPFLLRRNKDDYLKDLPKKSVQVITLSMGEEERSLYDATLLEAKKRLEKGEQGVAILALLTKLRELCVDPSSFFEGMPPLSSKLSYLLDTIKEAIAGGHKILLFSSFTKVLDHLRYLLDEEHIASYYINGDTEASLRLKIANSFNSGDEVKVLLVSLKAGGSGLNLQGADTVFHIDPWWNLAAEEQATDRAHRIGQTRPVTVFKLICHDTIEEKVIALQDKKKALYHSVIAEGEEGITHLSVDDLLYLLS
jgi:SNF2 family DNA or RNA helicase